MTADCSHLACPVFYRSLSTFVPLLTLSSDTASPVTATTEATDAAKWGALRRNGCPFYLKVQRERTGEQRRAETKIGRRPVSPSRAAMSMTCRDTNPPIDPTVRMISTRLEVFSPLLRTSIAAIPVLSSLAVQAVFNGHSAISRQNRQSGFLDTMVTWTTACVSRFTLPWRESVGSCTSRATMLMEVTPCSLSW
jgi:hypothetical protein